MITPSDQGVRLPARIKILSAALYHSRFTVQQLSDFTGLKAETVRTTLDRLHGTIVAVERVATGSRGGKPFVYEISPDHRARIEEELRLELERSTRSPAATAKDTPDMGSLRVAPDFSKDDPEGDLGEINVSLCAARDSIRRLALAATAITRRELKNNATLQLSVAAETLSSVEQRAYKLPQSAVLRWRALAFVRKLLSTELSQATHFHDAATSRDDTQRHADPEPAVLTERGRNAWRDLQQWADEPFLSGRSDAQLDVVPQLLFINTIDAAPSTITSVLRAHKLNSAVLTMSAERMLDTADLLRDLAADVNFSPTTFVAIDTADIVSRLSFDQTVAQFAGDTDHYWDALTVVDRSSDPEALACMINIPQAHYIARTDLLQESIFEPLMASAMRAPVRGSAQRATDLYSGSTITG